MSSNTRSLAAASIPTIGPLDITQDFFYIVCQMEDAIFLLVKIRYIGNAWSSGQTFSEYVLTPFYGAGNLNTEGNGNRIYVQGISIDSSNNKYNQPQDLDGVEGTYADGNFDQFLFDGSDAISSITFNFQDGLLIDDQGDYVKSGVFDSGPKHNDQPVTYSIATDDPSEASNLSLVTIGNPFFNSPNTYAGVNYSLSYNLVIPFRFLDPYELSANNYLITPSSCDPTGIAPIKRATYFCNNYQTVNPYNLLRFINYYYDTDNNLNKNIAYVDPPRQQRLNYINFLPSTNFYLGNANFSTVLNVGDGLCQTQNIFDPNYIGFLDSSYYFWASGFTEFRNSSGGAGQKIVSQGTPGFIPFGNSGPVNTTSWTSQVDCQRGYFYAYCGIGSFCGSCYGACVSGLPCTDNQQFTRPTPPPNTNPFVCGQSTPSVKTTIEAFWEQYKFWIIGGSILLFILIVGLLIAVFLISRARKNENKQAEVVYAGNTIKTKSNDTGPKNVVYSRPNYGGAYSRVETQPYSGQVKNQTFDYPERHDYSSIS